MIRMVDHETSATRFRPGAVVCSLALGFALAGCVAHRQPSVEAAKAVTIERFVDPRTVSPFGSVQVSVHVPPQARDRAEEYALDALKAQALRQFPETTLLFGVTLRAGSKTDDFVASGVAARSRGD
jgi:hypothetical protein